MVDQICKDYDVLYNKHIGEILKEIRVKNRWSSVQIADIIGIQYSRYYTYEIGSRQCPVSILKKFSMFFNIKMQDIINEAIRRTENDNPSLLNEKIEYVDDSETVSLG